MNPPEAKTPRWEAIDLSEFVAEIAGESGGGVTGVRKLVGGASKDIWAFEVQGAQTGVPRRFVLRRSASPFKASSLSPEGEFHVMRAAFEAGVAVPEPFFHGRDADGFGFFVMEFVEGETLAPRLFRKQEYAEARGRIASQLGRFLAPIHAVPIDERLIETLGPVPDGNPARREFDQYEANFRRAASGPHPIFELALRYLAARMPEPGEMTLVHGDYRLGNVVFGPEGVRSILDWELCHIGDPLQDITWPCVRAWRYGHDEKPVAGLGEREELFEAYEAASGRKIDRERARWWEIFGNLRWGIITLSQAAPYIDGTTGELEKGVIGRRAAEVEGELMNLIRE